MYRDWRNPEDYQFAKTLSPELWAWQFLRRNADYQGDYQWFIETWRNLEADYGKAPNRDFARWKLDERAYAPDEMTRGLCAEDKSCASPDGERVLIECAMGAKWGFYKFPNDPDLELPVVPDQLIWRELDRLLPGISGGNEPYEMDVRLDLRLPMSQQLQELKSLVLAQQRAYLREHGWHRQGLTRCLRLLDAERQGEDVLGMLYENNEAAYQHDRQQANVLVNGDYRLLVYANLK